MSVDDQIHHQWDDFLEVMQRFTDAVDAAKKSNLGLRGMFTKFGHKQKNLDTHFKLQDTHSWDEVIEQVTAAQEAYKNRRKGSGLSVTIYYNHTLFLEV